MAQIISNSVLISLYVCVYRYGCLYVFVYEEKFLLTFAHCTLYLTDNLNRDDILCIPYIKLHVTQRGFQSQWISVLVTSCEGPVYGTVYPPAEPGHSRVDSWKPDIHADVSPRGEPMKSAITHKQLSGTPLEQQNTRSVVAAHCLPIISLFTQSQEIIVSLQSGIEMSVAGGINQQDY